jgi:DNA-directed RNA polymerase subunit alpha
MEQLRIISGTSEDSLVKPAVQAVVETTFVSKDVIETPIEALDLTVRVFNALKRTGITTVGDVMELLDKGESAMLSIRNFGDKSLTELKAAMVEKGYLEKEEEVE